MRNSSRDRRVLLSLFLLLLIPTTIILIWSWTRPSPAIREPDRPRSSDCGPERYPSEEPSLPGSAARSAKGTGAGSTSALAVGRVHVLRGRVLLPDGEAAAGAQVSLRWRHLAVPPVEWPDEDVDRRPAGPPFLDLPGTVRAAADGEYELPVRIRPKDAPLPLEMLLLSARLDDFLASRYFLESSVPSLRLPDLVLVKGIAVRVRFLDYDDQPVCGVRARLSVRGHPPGWAAEDRGRWERHLIAATSDRDGCAVFRAVPANKRKDVDLFADHPNHPPAHPRLDWRALMTGKPVDVYLERGATIYGTVLDADGRPLAGASVYPAEVLYGEPYLVRERVAVTDQRGWFTLKGVPEEYVRPVVFRGPDLEFRGEDGWSELPFVFDTIICEHGLPLNLGELRLARTGAVSGVVSRPDGKPVPGVKIRIYPTASVASMSFTTRKNGTFELQLPPGTYRLDHTTQEVQVESGKKTTLRIECDPK